MSPGNHSIYYTRDVLSHMEIITTSSDFRRSSIAEKNGVRKNGVRVSEKGSHLMETPVPIDTQLVHSTFTIRDNGEILCKHAVFFTLNYCSTAHTRQAQSD